MNTDRISRTEPIVSRIVAVTLPTAWAISAKMSPPEITKPKRMSANIIEVTVIGRMFLMTAEKLVLMAAMAGMSCSIINGRVNHSMVLTDISSMIWIVILLVSID